MGTRKFRTGAAGRDTALEAATQLMAEQEKYEQWLEDLEAKKDSTPAKVFDRVRQDYLARLQTVMEQLTEHTATLQEHAENLMTKLRELEEAEEANSEAQEEAAIRKQVGEMTSAEWESGQRKAQRELAKIKESQTVILADLNRIRDLLGGDEDEAEPAPKPKGKSSRDFNELEFLSSVVGTETPAPTPAATGPRVTPSASPPKTVKPTPAAAQAAPPAAAAPPPAPVAAAPAPPPAPPAPAARAPTTETRPTGSSATQPRKSAMAEQPKTLKCQECGTMNFPSEWYCERCGAEMAVV